MIMGMDMVMTMVMDMIMGMDMVTGMDMVMGMVMGMVTGTNYKILTVITTVTGISTWDPMGTFINMKFTLLMEI